MKLYHLNMAGLCENISFQSKCGFCSPYHLEANTLLLIENIMMVRNQVWGVSSKSAGPGSILCRFKQGLIHYCKGPLVNTYKCISFPVVLLRMGWIWE